MYRLPGHIVIGPKTAWCGDKRAKIATSYSATAPAVKYCGNCGQIAKVI